MKILICVLLLSINLVNAQDMNCHEKVETLLIEKVKNYNSKDLIPYYSEKQKQWGFFDRNTGKILTEPILSRATFFNPNLELYYNFKPDESLDYCNGKIYGSSFSYEVISTEETGFTLPTVEGPIDIEKNKYKIFEKNSINGFEVDEYGNLSYFNSKFYDVENDSPLIVEIIPFKNKYYALTKVIENEKHYYTFIDQNGEELTNFQKTKYYPNVKPIFSNDDDIWVLLKSSDGKYVYKSLFKNKTFKDSFDDDTIYGRDQSQNLGYVIYTVNNKNGVLDLTTMEWKIKPTNKIKFSYIEYASSSVLDSKDIEQNRRNSNIYLQTNNHKFYDLNLKLYKPKI